MNSQQRLAINPVCACLPLLLVFAGCDFIPSATILGSGVTKTETREIANFSEIEVGNAIQLDATIGPAISLEVTSDDNLLPHIQTVVAGKKLKIYMEGSCSTNLGVQVKLAAPALTALVASGAARTTLSGVTGQQFQLDLSGASTCELTSDTDELKVTLSGASNSTITGKAKRLAANCSGASQMDANGLTVENANIELSGASNGKVNATGELTAAASGASTLRYIGQPAHVERQVSGASTIEAE